MSRSSRRPTSNSDIGLESDSRYHRYKRIVDWAVERTEFQLDDAKASVTEERPGFVTRLVHDLEQSGYLVRIDDQPASFRWNQRKPFCGSRWIDEKLFGSQIKESPEQDRPRERLLTHGAAQLTLAELLAILIRSGRPGESAVMGGQKVARHFGHRVQDLPASGRAELKAISRAVEKTAYCQIMAGIELGRRVAAVADTLPTERITSSTAAIDYCQRHFQRLANDAKQEEFHIITVDTKNQVIDTHRVTVGTLDASLVHPREVFRPAIRDAASSVILVHNHPSGDPTPSREDLAVTDRLIEAGRVIGIDVLDHVVLGKSCAVSIQESR